MDIQVVTILEVSWIMLPWTFMHNLWVDIYLLLLLDRYLEKELLDHMMSIFFNEKLFSNTSTVSTVSYIPSSHVGYSFLHSCQPLFLSTYYSHLCGYEVVSYHNFGLYFPNNIQGNYKFIMFPESQSDLCQQGFQGNTMKARCFPGTRVAIFTYLHQSMRGTDAGHHKNE